MILLTGSGGFIGTALLDRLDCLGFDSCLVVRSPEKSPLRKVKVVPDISNDVDYGDSLNGVEVVIHLAARAHVMKDTALDPLSEYRKVNVVGSENLARQAANSGVRRFVFVSSIKVSGESTTGRNPYKENMLPEYDDFYGQSKYEAENALRKISAETGMELVIIRPPLVYGPGVKANFLSLIKLASAGIPLPFGSVNNRRSMVYVGNLVDFIIHCIDHPKAANQTFLVSDVHDVSLSELIRLIRQSMKRPAWLIPVPVSLFQLAGKLTGKMALVDRLVGDLQVDSRKARELLNWTPPYTLEEGIKETVAEFINRKT